jgi:hypothetical protein
MTVPINLRVRPYYRGTKTLDNNSYNLSIHWNVNTSKWYLDIVGITNDVSIKGMAILAGKNLLAPYGYYELGELWVIDNSGANEDPNYADIGVRFTLEYTPLT